MAYSNARLFVFSIAPRFLLFFPAVNIALRICCFFGAAQLLRSGSVLLHDALERRFAYLCRVTQHRQLIRREEYHERDAESDEIEAVVRDGADAPKMTVNAPSGTLRLTPRSTCVWLPKAFVRSFASIMGVSPFILMQQRRAERTRLSYSLLTLL